MLSDILNPNAKIVPLFMHYHGYNITTQAYVFII